MESVPRGDITILVVVVVVFADVVVVAGGLIEFVLSVALLLLDRGLLLGWFQANRMYNAML